MRPGAGAPVEIRADRTALVSKDDYPVVRTCFYKII
jgi:hypothetical protein